MISGSLSQIEGIFEVERPVGRDQPDASPFSPTIGMLARLPVHRGSVQLVGILPVLFQPVRSGRASGPVLMRRLEGQRTDGLGGGQDLGGFVGQAIVAVVADRLGRVAGP